jgi:CheY-like chemotaxis protein
VLTIEVAERLPAAKVDPNQLELALLNLVMNSRDAMSGAGAIRIAVTSEALGVGQVNDLQCGRYVRLMVEDTGHGMDEETRKRAVEPFFSTKGIGKGTGLGLSMAHGLASQLGGALTIESQVGHGTRVSIWLPESFEPVQSTSINGRSDGRRIGAGTALLVDDEETVRISTADMLAELGFTVHEALSAKAALDAMDAGLQPDLLVTDHLMPGMSGVELAALVGARHPITKILIISGFAELAGIDPSLPRLTKPFLQSDLAAAIAELQSK